MTTISTGEPDGQPINQQGRSVFSTRGVSELPNGSTVAKLGCYSSYPRTVWLKIYKKINSSNYEIVVDLEVSHTGSGWEDFNLPIGFIVPPTGEYNLGSHYDDVNGFDCVSGKPKSYINDVNLGIGQHSGIIPSTGWVPCVRATLGEVQGETVDTSEPTNPTGVYKTIAGVLRNTGSGWFLLEDGGENSGHEAINIVSVSTVDGSSPSGYVQINYGFTGSKVVTMSISPDETFAQAGIVAGASVSRGNAKIKFGKNGVARSPNSVSSQFGNFWVNGIIKE